MLLEGETRQVLGFAVLVYLLPLVLFFVGYGVGAGMKLGGGLSALIGGVLFVNEPITLRVALRCGTAIS